MGRKMVYPNKRAMALLMSRWLLGSERALLNHLMFVPRTETRWSSKQIGLEETKYRQFTRSCIALLVFALLCGVGLIILKAQLD